MGEYCKCCKRLQGRLPKNIEKEPLWQKKQFIIKIIFSPFLFWQNIKNNPIPKKPLSFSDNNLTIHDPDEPRLSRPHSQRQCQGHEELHRRKHAEHPDSEAEQRWNGFSLIDRIKPDFWKKYRTSSKFTRKSISSSGLWTWLRNATTWKRYQPRSTQPRWENSCRGTRIWPPRSKISNWIVSSKYLTHLIFSFFHSKTGIRTVRMHLGARKTGKGDAKR